MVIKIKLACCLAASLMPPSMYSAMIGSTSSPILNSTTRGRAAESDARLVCALAAAPKANSSAKIMETRRIMLATVRCGFAIGCEDT